jgi:hypothetical protein
MRTTEDRPPGLSMASRFPNLPPSFCRKPLPEFHEPKEMKEAKKEPEGFSCSEFCTWVLPHKKAQSHEGASDNEPTSPAPADKWAAIAQPYHIIW